MLKSGSNFVTLPPLPCSMCLPTSGIDQCMKTSQFSSKGPGPRATIFRSKAAPSQPGTKNVLTYAFGHNFQHQEGNGPTWCQSLTLGPRGQKHFMRLACQFGQPEKVISTHVLSPYLHPDHPSFLHQDHHHMNAMTCSKQYTNMSVGPVRAFYAYMSSCACMLKSGSNFVRVLT